MKGFLSHQELSKLLLKIKMKAPSELTEHEQLIILLDKELQKKQATTIKKEHHQQNADICSRHSQKCLLLKTIPEIVMEVNNQKVYTWANQSGTDFFGSDVIGKEASYYFVGEQDTYENVKPLFDGVDDIFYTESWQRRQDGEERLLAWWSRVLKDKKENVIGAISSARDITEQKRNENKIRESQELIESIINSIPVRVFWKDKNLIYLGCNEIFAKDGGLSNPKDIIGKNDYQMTWKNQAELYRSDDMQVIKSGKAKLLIEEPQTTPNGDTIYLLTSKVPLKDSTGKINGVLGTYLDITEFKKTEQNLLFEQHLLDSLMNSSPDVIYFKDINSQFIRINKSHAELFGLKDPNKAIGKTDSDFFASEHSSDAFNDEQKIIKTGIPVLYKEELETWPDGRTTWAQTTKLPLRNQDGKIIGTFGISRDITKQKLAEQELISAKQKAEESDRLKSAFLANMSHEIRTPMNAILGFANFLKEPDFSDNEKEEFIKLIETSGSHMLDVINDIICISIIQSGQTNTHIANVNVYELINQIHDSYEETANRKGLELIVETPNKHKTIVIESDKEKIQAILTYLIKNALKFTHEGSIILGFEEEDGFLKFFVKDTGIGLNEENADILFKEFRQSDESLTRNFGGIGLGLAISRAYVKILGGKIWVSSKKDEGSTFYFTIHIQQQE